MLRLVGRRLLAAIPTLFFVVTLSFFLLNLVPGDPAATLAGDSATPEQVEAVRVQLGLDRSLPEQYVSYMGDVVRGDLGTSLVNGDSVWHRIWQAIPITASLTLVAMVFTVLLGIPAGVFAALRRGRWVDHAVTVISSIGMAIPPFVIGLVLVIPFALDRSWFPAAGYVPLADGVGNWLEHLVLPGLALAFAPAAEVARQTRGSFVDTMEEDFIRTGEATGLRPRSLIGKHAAKSAAIPVVTVLGLQIGRIVGGAVVIELIFAMPGLGSLALDAVLARDVPLVQGIVIVTAVIVILTNLVTDLSYGYFDPRVRTAS